MRVEQIGGDVVQVGVGSGSGQGSVWDGLRLEDEDGGLVVLFFFCAGDCVGVVQMEEDEDMEVILVDLVLFHFLLIPILAYSSSSSMVREEAVMDGLVGGRVLAEGS